MLLNILYAITVLTGTVMLLAAFFCPIVTGGMAFLCGCIGLILITIDKKSNSLKTN